jgi:hypothetical protein
MGDFQVGLFGLFLSLPLGSVSGRQHPSRCTARADQPSSPDVVGSVFFPKCGDAVICRPAMRWGVSATLGRCLDS